MGNRLATCYYNPMLIFLSGPINSGKTITSKALAARLNAAYINVDDLNDLIPNFNLATDLDKSMDLAIQEINKYAAEGKDVVANYVVRQEDYDRFDAELKVQPWFVITLAPRLEVAQSQRGERVLREWEIGRIQYHYDTGIATPKFGHIIDNSDITIEQTVDKILDIVAENTKYQALLLPGGGVLPNGDLDLTVKPRLEKAAELYKAGKVPAIITCGSHSYKIEKPDLTEAQAYANYLISLGVPSESIYLEEESQESLGNILFAKTNILMQQNWHKLLVIPTYKQTTERIDYLLQKILGSEYEWEILRVGENTEPSNLEREAKALRITKEINDVFADGDHEAIYKGLMETHPAYGGTRWTIEELTKEMRG